MSDSLSSHLRPSTTLVKEHLKHNKDQAYFEDLLFAHTILDEIDAFTLPKYHCLEFTIDTKPDLTPVTNVDIRTEEMLIEAVSNYCSSDGVLGEEHEEKKPTVLEPRKSSTSEDLILISRRWVVDPIDGTKNFVRHVPVWATLLALEEIYYDKTNDSTEKKLVLGCVSAPALNKRWFAGLGLGSFVIEGPQTIRPLSVSKISQLSHASFSYSSLEGWKTAEDSQNQKHNLLPRFLDLSSKLYRTRAYGDFWSYCLLAEGSIDIAAEPELNFYDMAALVPIITESGGTFTSLDGKIESAYGPNALASNSFLHQAAVKNLWPNQS